VADIKEADSVKLRFRIMHRLLGGSKEFKNAHADMRDCTNPVFRKTYMELIKTCSKIRQKHQRHIVADFGTWLLWVLYKDTAYNPISLYILKQLINDELWVDEINKQAVDTTDDLYANRWANTLDTTKQMRDEGKLSKYELSSSEQIYVPGKQDFKHAKMNEEELTAWTKKKVEEDVRRRGRK